MRISHLPKVRGAARRGFGVENSHVAGQISERRWCRMTMCPVPETAEPRPFHRIMDNRRHEPHTTGGQRGVLVFAFAPRWHDHDRWHGAKPRRRDDRFAAETSVPNRQVHECDRRGYPARPVREVQRFTRGGGGDVVWKCKVFSVNLMSKFPC